MLWDGNGKEFSGTSMAIRCYESHPVLKVGKGKLYGGNARNPVVKNADVYVVLQNGDMEGRGSDPWEKQTVTEVAYFMKDMHAPENVARFKKLVTWICTQLQAGKSVHVGCIGGHGRTGTVLSAIVAECLGEKDAIQYVRKHYCKKAVESKAQVDFLAKHYGVSKVDPTKGENLKVSKGSFQSWTEQPWQTELPVVGKSVSKAVRRILPEGLSKSTKSFSPIASPRSLWKEPK